MTLLNNRGETSIVYDVIIIGTGPAGLGAAFYLVENGIRSILMVDKSRLCTGGLRNDCKQNYTFPVGFPEDLWSREEADSLLEDVACHLEPRYEEHGNVEIFRKRAEKLGVKMLTVRQSHVGTDKSSALIRDLLAKLDSSGVEIRLSTEVSEVDWENSSVTIAGTGESLIFHNLIAAPGRAGYEWLQRIMDTMGVKYVDNVVDVGVRVEAREDNYPVVRDYYDPKFIFPDGVRTFCTNSGAAFVVQEKYQNYYSVNGHAMSREKKSTGLVNFAMLKTITLTDPVVSGHQFADALGQMAMRLSGGKPMMQRVGDFRMGKRSKASTFNDDLYDFAPTLKGATPGDISLAVPSKILRDIWRSMKMLDTIVPGILHPSSILYYPEIKTYANRPEFIDRHFRVKRNVFIAGDGAGTSRGITAAWASGIRAARGIVNG
ncbi:MAG TPA: FAD-dependent monooxygenase [Spirochaetota bacterium]|nr:FAD-dependent monooxygenase [Spirochaetota bacterium]